MSIKGRKSTKGRHALTVIQRYFPEVAKVRDAKAKIAIEVTARDEATSNRGKHKTCAMAVACQRAMHLDGVIIARTTAYLIKDRQATRYVLPPSVAREVTSFDRGAGFAPGLYHLAKPRPSSMLGAGHTGGEEFDRSPATKQAEPKHFTTGIRAVLGSTASHASEGVA